MFFVVGLIFFGACAGLAVLSDCVFLILGGRLLVCWVGDVFCGSLFF